MHSFGAGCLYILCACEGNKLLSVLLQEGDNVCNHKPNRLSGYELVSYTCLPGKKNLKIILATSDMMEN